MKAERCRTAPSRCGKRYFFSSIFFLLNSAEILHEDLSFYKVDRILCAEPAMTAARMLLSFGGHQLQAYTCYSRSLVRGVPGPAGVTHKEREMERWGGGGSSPRQFENCCHFTVIWFNKMITVRHIRAPVAPKVRSRDAAGPRREIKKALLTNQRNNFISLERLDWFLVAHFQDVFYICRRLSRISASRFISAHLLHIVSNITK